MSNRPIDLATHFVLFILAFAEPLCADDSPSSPASKSTPTNTELRQELLRRKTLDQHSRQKVIETLNKQGLDWSDVALSDASLKPLAEVVRRIDQDNRHWLTEVIDRQGWPLVSQVGKDGARAAFLIAQHADDDLEFQKRCLSLMRVAPEGEVALPDVALLTDRTRLAEGKQQLYGSQVDRRDGMWVLRPTAGPDNLDARRAAMGLPPLAIYLELLDKAYRTSPATSGKQRDGEHSPSAAFRQQ